MSTSLKGTKMATATSSSNTTGRSWAAANVNQHRDGRKWNEDLQRELIEAVKQADKAGLSRQRVYLELAEKFTRDRNEMFTAKQVSSQFHLTKDRFGYDVARQEQRAPGASRPRARKLLAQPTLTRQESARNVRLVKALGDSAVQALAAAVQAMRDLNERAETAERERDEARAQLTVVKAALK